MYVWLTFRHGLKHGLDMTQKPITGTCFVFVQCHISISMLLWTLYNHQVLLEAPGAGRADSLPSGICIWVTSGI